MLIEKGDKFLISDCTQIQQIKIFIKKNRKNPNIHRKKTLDELYSLYIYLHNLCGSEYFSLPLLVQKPDPPDFVLDQQVVGHKTGIEVVSLATQNEKQASAIMEKECPSGLLEKSFYFPGSSAKLTDGIRKPNEKLTNSGFGNYGEEKAWLACIRQTLNKKSSKLNKNKEHYFQYQGNELIIYDDTGYFPEVDYVIANLQQDYKSSSKINYNRVHIIMNVVHLFIVDVFAQCTRFVFPYDII